MSVKRLRIFAGPNGSGKSTLINKLQKNPPSSNFKLGYYVNADDIEKELKKNASIDFNIYGINATTKQIQSYFKKSSFSPVKTINPELWRIFAVSENSLTISDKGIINSYVAADLAEFIRQQIMKEAHSFTYETVMSDNKKIKFLKKAKNQGYKIYLYYIATEDPLININKVELRVAQHGHDVKSQDVIRRYYKSLENLKPAIMISDRAYLFDSSKGFSVLIAEITEGKNVTLVDVNNIPNWVSNALK